MAGSYLGFTLGDATDAVLGTYTADPTVLIAGTDRSSSAIREGGEFELSLGLGQPGVCRITAYANGWTPAKGNSLEIRDDGASGSAKWFSGTITQVSRRIEMATTRLLYSLIAQDHRWLLDRYATVTGWWASKGINTIARDVIARFTDGGFAIGYAPAALGSLDYFEATEQRVSQVLDRLAQAAGAYWEVDADKRVHLYTTPDHQSAGVVEVDNTAGSAEIAEFHWSDDLTDIATRVRVIASGTTLRQAVAAAEVNYAYVYDVSQFNSSSGTAYIGTDLVTYAGTTNVSGSEALVGTLSGLTRDWPEGTPVRPVITVNDSSAQTTLATTLGGGLSGIAIRSIDDDTLTAAEATARANADLDLLSAGVPMLQGIMVDGVHTDAQHCWPGATITVSLTSPVTLSGTWRIQSVRLSPRGTVGGGTRWARAFTASPVRRGTELIDLLGGL